MTVRFYIIPIDEQGIHRGPKYIKWRFNLAGLDVEWQAIDYGLIPAMLVAADVTTAQHTQLVSEPDVVAAPENIDQNISDIAIPDVVTVLEQLRIPAGWVDNTFNYRQILRMVGSLFQFAQRHHITHDEPLIDNTAQLDLRWNQIPLSRRDRIKATADSLGYDYSWVTNTMLIRQILKGLADQWGDKPFKFGDLAIL